jgi:large subunit ribosomal protein L7A
MTKLDFDNSEKLKVGIKQASRAVIENRAKALYIAKDAEQHVTRRIIELAGENGVEIVFVESMKDLGRACKIDVGAATAVVLK